MTRSVGNSRLARRRARLIFGNGGRSVLVVVGLLTGEGLSAGVFAGSMDFVCLCFITDLSVIRLGFISKLVGAVSPTPNTMTRCLGQKRDSRGTRVRGVSEVLPHGHENATAAGAILVGS